MLRWIDGADDNLDIVSLDRDYNLVTISGLSVGQPGYQGGLCYSQSSSAGLYARFVTKNLQDGVASPDSAWTFGFRFQTTAATAVDPDHPLLAASPAANGSTPVFRAVLMTHVGESGYRLHFYCAEILIGSTAVLSPGEWHYVEGHLVADASDGSLTVRVDGHEHFSATGQITLAGSISNLSYWAFNLASNGLGTQKLTDIYIADGSTGYRGGMPPDEGFMASHKEGVIVKSAAPIADVTPQDWLPSSNQSQDGKSLIIALGQSNMDGSSLLASADPRFAGPQTGRLIWNPITGVWETLDADTNNNQSRYVLTHRDPLITPADMCPMLSFMELLKAYDSDEDTLLIKNAKGSTWMFFWPPPGPSYDSWTYFAGNNFGVDLYYTLLADTINALLAAHALYPGEQINIRSIIMMQGETDCLWLGGFGLPQPELPSQLWGFMFRVLYQRFQSDLRLILGTPNSPDIPWIFGRAHVELPNTGEAFGSFYWTERVREAQEGVAADPNLNVSIVDLDGLSFADAGVHFDSPSLEIVGQRLFDAYVAGQSHYDRVADFASPDDDTFVQSDTLGASELFRMSGLKNGLYAMRGYQMVADARATAGESADLRMLLSNEEYADTVLHRPEKKIYIADTNLPVSGATLDRVRVGMKSSPDLWPYSFDPVLFSLGHKGFKMWSLGGVDAPPEDGEEVFETEPSVPVAPGAPVAP